MTPRITLPLAPTLFALLLLAYLLPGLVGHDPWKIHDAVGVGIVHQMLQHGQWIVPHLGGEPYFEDGPFFYWIAALTTKLFAALLAPHDGARIASGMLAGQALAWYSIALALREPRLAGWLLGAGVAVAVLSKGPAAAIAPAV